jgi:hypothetical protein
MQMHFSKYLSLFSLVIAFQAPHAAWAQMGTVAPINQSSINQPEDEPEVTEEKPAEVKEMPKNDPVIRDALLTIRYNSRRVYYERALEQAIAGARAIKPLSNYKIVSYEPSNVANSPSGQERLNASFAENLKVLMLKMQQLGVKSSQMRPERKASSDIRYQEIQVFVE